MRGADNGGPAFPTIDSPGCGLPLRLRDEGMSLLDWFAGEGLAGLLLCIQSTAHDNIARGVPREQVDQITRSSLRTIAEKTYDLAEHMVAEKRKREGA